jgi:hypothetical protein
MSEIKAHLPDHSSLSGPQSRFCYLSHKQYGPEIGQHPSLGELSVLPPPSHRRLCQRQSSDMQRALEKDRELELADYSDTQHRIRPS